MENDPSIHPACLYFQSQLREIVHNINDGERITWDESKSKNYNLIFQ